MARRPSWADLQNWSDEQLIAEHDRLAKNTELGTRSYLDELRYRNQARVAAQIKRFTRWIFWMTLVVTGATVINVAVLVFG